MLTSSDRPVVALQGSFGGTIENAAKLYGEAISQTGGQNAGSGGAVEPTKGIAPSIQDPTPKTPKYDTGGFELHKISPEMCPPEFRSILRDDEKRTWTVAECEAAQVLRAEVLLHLPKCYALNLQADQLKIEAFVNSLVRLDRLPPENPVEGLELLIQAWNEYDIAQYLAGRYKMAAKALFILQLLVSWLIVMLATLTAGGISGVGNATDIPGETGVAAQPNDASTLNALASAVFGHVHVPSTTRSNRECARGHGWGCLFSLRGSLQLCACVVHADMRP